jgi:type II restriction enzyme
MTEGWIHRNMYCPACPSPTLQSARTNTPVVDFTCSSCGAEFQVKSQKCRMGRKVRDAAYEPMIQRILEDRCPHLVLLEYNLPGCPVRNLVVVPGHFVTPNVIERCKPLSEKARRRGWVGCNILREAIPAEGLLSIVSDSVPIPSEKVREEWRSFAWLADATVEDRGWTGEVLRCIRKLGSKEFSIQDVYRFEQELASAHPANRNVRAKIRQRLQVLRDRNTIRFLGNGRYQMLAD